MSRREFGGIAECARVFYDRVRQRLEDLHDGIDCFDTNLGPAILELGVFIRTVPEPLCSPESRAASVVRQRGGGSKAADGLIVYDAHSGVGSAGLIECRSKSTARSRCVVL